MKKYSLAIVTKGRVGMDYTLKFLSNYDKIDILIFCGEDEVNYYKKYSNKVFSQGNEGLCKAKNNILDYFKEQNIEHGIICDDDILGISELYLEDDKVKRRPIEGEKLYEVLDEMLDKSKEYCLVNLAWKAFNNFLLKKWPQGYLINRKLVSVFVMYNVKMMFENKLRFDEEMLIFEDIDLTIETIKKKQKTFSYFKYELSSCSGIEGGCFETYKKKDFYRDLMLKKHGDHLKITKSKNKTYEFNLLINFKTLLNSDDDLKKYYI